MMQNPQLAPKYYVFHDTESFGVFTPTAAQSFSDCAFLAMNYFPAQYEQYEEGNSRYQISLIEVRLVDNAN